MLACLLSQEACGRHKGLPCFAPNLIASIIFCFAVCSVQIVLCRMVDMRSESGFTPLHFAVSASNATAGQSSKTASKYIYGCNISKGSPESIPTKEQIKLPEICLSFTSV